MLVNLNTEYADANKTRVFNKPSKNRPTDMTNEYFMGIWICHWHSVNHVMVELIEMYPVAGRRWTNFYNNTQWTGWKSITPQ